jgi:type II secretory pathway component PulM
MARLAAVLRTPAPIARWLAGKSRGERRIVAAIAALAAVALLWIALWQPLVRDTAAMRAAQPGNTAALAGARRMTAEIAGLARTPSSPAAADARAGLERVLAQQNLRPAVTQLEWQDGRARVVFAAVGYDALIVALEALQREARLRAVDLTMTARVEPGLVRAELTLAR